jgi:hypothetical protein
MKLKDSMKTTSRFGLGLALATMLTTAANAALWDLTGNWNIGIAAAMGSFTLVMDITSEDFSTGSFTGTDSQGYQISGTTTGSAIQFTDLGGPGYWCSFTGTIAPNGTMSGGGPYYATAGGGGTLVYGNEGSSAYFWTEAGHAVSVNPVLISGQVTCCCDTNPIADALVTIGDHSTNTGSGGNYIISTVQPGTLSVTVSADNYVTTNTTITTSWSGTNVIEDFSLSPLSGCPVTITGQVNCSCDTNAIAGALVTVGDYSTTTDSGGNYSIRNVQPGRYNVTVTAANYVTTNATVTIASGASTVTDNFVLSPSLSLDYFGVGVNWQSVDPPGSCSLRGDVCATELYFHLRSDLSSVCKPGTVVTLNAAEGSDANVARIMSQFNQFTNNVCPNDTVVFYVDSHAGCDGLFGIQISLASDYNDNPVFDAFVIADMLANLPSSTRKVLILDTCHSGGIAEEVVDFLSNTEALAACSGDCVKGVAQFQCSAGSDDGISIFTDSIITNLDNGVFDLHQIAANIGVDLYGTYESDIGQNLPLEDSGSAIFMGLQPQLWERSGVSGNLGTNVVSILQAPPREAKAMITNGSFQMALMDMPTQGAVAVELSTNLISWLQVGFYPAAGTNVNFTFATTNCPTAFFRSVVVP